MRISIENSERVTILGILNPECHIPELAVRKQVTSLGTLKPCPCCFCLLDNRPNIILEDSSLIDGAPHRITHGRTLRSSGSTASASSSPNNRRIARFTRDRLARRSDHEIQPRAAGSAPSTSGNSCSIRWLTRLPAPASCRGTLRSMRGNRARLRLSDSTQCQRLPEPLPDTSRQAPCICILGAALRVSRRR